MSCYGKLESVPEEPGNKSLVIDKATYDRLLRACNFKSKEQLEQEKQQLNTQRDQLLVSWNSNGLSDLLKSADWNFENIQSDINERKKIIQQYDSERKKNEKLAEIDQLAKEEAEYLLKKANELRQEQEDEVKRLNEVSPAVNDKLPKLTPV